MEQPLDPLKLHKDKDGKVRDQEGYEWHEQSFGTENTKTKGGNIEELEGLYGGAQSIIRMFDVLFPPGVKVKYKDAFEGNRKYIEQSMYDSGLDYDERFGVRYFPLEGGVKIAVVCKKAMLATQDRFDYSLLPGSKTIRNVKGNKIKTQKVGNLKQEIIDGLSKK